MPLVNLSFVPPGGGEQDHMLKADLPEVPRAGDTILVTRDGGPSAFIVRGVRWNIYAKEGEAPHPGECWVFAEFADAGGLNGDAHQRSLDVYQARGKVAKEFPHDGY